jgi:Flp pilus assembly protein TadB
MSSSVWRLFRLAVCLIVIFVYLSSIDQRIGAAFAFGLVCGASLMALMLTMRYQGKL